MQPVPLFGDISEKKRPLLTKTKNNQGSSVGKTPTVKEQPNVLDDEVTSLIKLCSNRLYDNAHIEKEVTEIKELLENSARELGYGIPSLIIKIKFELEKRPNLAICQAINLFIKRRK